MAKIKIMDPGSKNFDPRTDFPKSSFLVAKPGSVAPQTSPGFPGGNTQTVKVVVCPDFKKGPGI